MPKVSDYELEHLSDTLFETTQKFKKKSKQVKEKKYPEKKDPRTEWKKVKEIVEESFEDDSLELEE